MSQPDTDAGELYHGVADMKRLLAAKPKGVRGLAVAGMPIGSSGKEVRGVASDRYEVIAFGASKPVVFSRHRVGVAEP